jgi:alkylation response protein AidB-like acyl-CoA dehydrogenase
VNFLLSDDQIALQDTLRSLLAHECAPRRVHAVIDGPGGFDEALWRKLVEFGVTGISIPQSHGGLGLRMIDLAIVAELLGEYAAPVPFLGHALACLAVTFGGSDAQKARWLPRMASGELLGTVALGEGAARWLPAQWTLGGGGVLNGVKHLVPNAAEAELLVVGVAGGGLSIVEGRAGIETDRIDAVDRTRPVDRTKFTDVRGEPLEYGGEAASKLVDSAAVLLAADAFGGASHCVSMAVEYAKVREQFGVPIGSFQGLKHQLANMALAVEPARGLFWYAAHALDALPDTASHAAAQAKAHVCDVYLQATRDTVEAHGGIGFTWEHDAHIYLKRAMFDWAWLGQPARHRLRAAALAGW